MKKKIKLGAILVIVVILSVAWCWRYLSLNKYYQSEYGTTTAYYSTGDLVSFDDNISVGGLSWDGYSIKVNSARIVDCEDYLAEYNMTLDNLDNAPDKVCEVTITLYNASSTAKGVYLNDIILHGLDNYTDMNRDLLAVANPVLKGALGISLAANTEYTVRLVYNLREMHFTKYTWEHLDDYKLWLKLTSSPIVKEIELDL